MGYDDKIKNEVDEAKGEVKEWVGDKTNNPNLVEEGRGDQAEANARQAGEHVKDAAKDVKDALN